MLLIYFTFHGIQLEIPSADPSDGCCPIGALALTATSVSDGTLSMANFLTSVQVEWGYHMHSSGDYISGGSYFSSSKWHATTEFYTDKIQNDLTGDNWTMIFKALHHFEDSNVQDS